MVIHVFRDFCQKIFKVIIGLKVGYPGKAVNNRTGLCSGNGVDHHPVFLADTESADRLLRSVVIHWNLSILQENISDIVPDSESR